MIVNRDLRVDVLKAVSILIIILAHAKPPSWLFNVRIFDVVLLVFVSGLTLKWHGESLKEYLIYIRKRFFRLVVPAWEFVVIFYAFSFLMSFANPRWNFKFWDCLNSFAFVGGFGYLWIIRVYFGLALVSPLIVGVTRCKAYQRYWYLVLALLLVLNELLISWSVVIASPFWHQFFTYAVIYTLGYSIVELFAVTSKSVKIRNLFLFAFVALVLVWPDFGLTRPASIKYPPRDVYLLYGCAVSLVVYYLTGILVPAYFKPGAVRSRLKDVVVWISDNSLWIYLWHIIPLTIIEKGKFLGHAWVLKFVIVLAVGCLLTLLHNKVKAGLVKRG